MSCMEKAWNPWLSVRIRNTKSAIWAGKGKCAKTSWSIRRNELSNLILELSAIERNMLIKWQNHSRSSDCHVWSTGKQSSYCRLKPAQQLHRAPKTLLHNRATGWIHNQNDQKRPGETLKENDDIVTIVPASYELAIELYIKPQMYPCWALAALFSWGSTVGLPW